jgi:hypothetical protein
MYLLPHSTEPHHKTRIKRPNVAQIMAASEGAGIDEDPAKGPKIDYKEWSLRQRKVQARCAKAVFLAPALREKLVAAMGVAGVAGAGAGAGSGAAAAAEAEAKPAE